MRGTYEVLSAFLDDEPFATEELTNALSDPTGRALLIDLLQLRRIVQPSESLPAMAAETVRRRSAWRVVATAAALFVALAGGYVIGEQQSSRAAVEAPQPTRVVNAVPFTPAGDVR